MNDEQPQIDYSRGGRFGVGVWQMAARRGGGGST